MTKYTNIIEQFLDNEMTAEQEAAFKEQVKTDHDLAREVEAHLLATDGIQYFQEHSSSKSIEAEAVSEAPKIQKQTPGMLRRIRPIIGFAAAASVALLIYFIIPKNPYQHYVLDITEMSGETATLQQAQDTYNSKDYAAAIPLFKKFPDNMPIQIAKANAHYNLGEFDAAIATLQPITSGNSGHKNTANWYLALTYLKQENQTEKAKIALKKIKSGTYYDKAQKLLKKLSE